jgi:alpha-glucosidase
MTYAQLKHKVAEESMKTHKNTLPGVCLVVLLLLSGCLGEGRAQAVMSAPRIEETAGSLRIATDAGILHVEMIASNILRVSVQQTGKPSPRTLVIDPNLNIVPYYNARNERKEERSILHSSQMYVSIRRAVPYTVTVFNAAGEKLLEQENPFNDAHDHGAVFTHRANENLYGMSGLSMRENGGNILRNNGSIIAAGNQGDAGAPWFFSTSYGVLIDSNGGVFNTRDDSVEFSSDSRNELEYFVFVGKPLEVMSGLSLITGRPPLPPKWSLGFINSQWGATEDEVKHLAATYRAKHIPLDAFIFDFDWKAWGEDHYGEWRWNSTSTPESFSPNKFPDGASGELAKQMRAEGIKFLGILKPRILLYKKGSTTEMHEASAYAESHKLWYPDEPVIIDYVTGEPARDLDFSKAETRSWYWKHLEPAFDAGMVGWWSDEADNTGIGGGHTFDFDNFQFMNMGRALYEGQRAHAQSRVWSINRNYYAGAQRYGYAEWSGDIQTGFHSMAHQPARMMSTLNLGEPHWSMDTGGFFGHPTPENYARWMEFAAFVPIDRVHGSLGEKRQPWVYGPIAEAAASKALDLRYQLLPYIYSYERMATESGIGVVRPLFWMFPDDKKLANESSAWMFGDALLVSPVLVPGESTHTVYLPAGVWYDYFRGTRHEGAQTLPYAVDAKNWQDIPVFVRSGSMLATQPIQNYVDETPAREVTIDVFPDANVAKFIYYDDDGESYAYEKGNYYRQQITAQKNTHETELFFDKPAGEFHPVLRAYLVRVHGIHASAVIVNGVKLDAARSEFMQEGQWVTGLDRFGFYTAFCLHADQSSKIVIAPDSASKN